MQYSVKFSFVSFLFSFYTIAVNDTIVNKDPYRTFIDQYIRYMNGFGCDAPLCGENTANETDNRGYIRTPDYENTNTRSRLNVSRCCSKCSCGAECEREGNCCPDIIANFPNASTNYPLGGIYGCGYTSIKEKPEFSNKSTKVINRCNKTYDENENDILNCESSPKETLEGYVIVSDKLTNETYRNIFCSRCNYVGDEDIVTWEIKLKCQHGTLVPQSISTAIQEIKESNHCNLVFEPPLGFDYFPCNQLISSCNVTGLWQVEDTLTERACHAYTSEFKDVTHSYRNTFCFVCNSNNSLTHKCPDLGAGIILIPHISFSALLDFSEMKGRGDADVCSDIQVYDYYKNVCRDVICPVLTVYSNGSCSRLKLLYSASDICFEAAIRVSTVPPSSNDELYYEINNYFEEITEKCNGTVNYTLTDVNSLEDQGLSIGYYIFHVWFTNDINFMDTLRNLDGLSMKLYRHEENMLITTAIIQDHIKQQSKNVSINLNFKMVTLDEISHIPTSSKDHSCNETFRISKLQCPMIELNVSDFVILSNESDVFHNDLNLFLVEKDFIWINKSKIRVCVSDYILATEKYAKNLENGIKSLITLISICCSIACLIITITVYCLFSELRTQPGINNMCMSVFQLLAYICLLIGGIRSLQHQWCKVIGLFVHFLWLNSILWLNICCFHMFRTFVYIRNPTKEKVRWLYYVYSLTSSTILLNVNIMWTLSTSEGNEIGYGKHAMLCYITNPHMIAFTMVIPIALVVISNCIMYITVVCKIQRNTFSRNSKRNRNNMSVYIRLSTITGLSWLGYLPIYFLGIAVYDLIFSLLIGCQGIFIMLAFMCNKRVMILCKQFILDHIAHFRQTKGKHNKDKGKREEEKETVSSKL